MAAEPEDQMAVAAAARSRLRASHADREQVIDMLKAAFVHGRVTKDEFDARVGRAFASRTYAELAAVTADIPARQIADQPPGNPACAQGRPTMSHATKARRCVVIALAMMTVATFAPDGPALFLFAPLGLTGFDGCRCPDSRHTAREALPWPAGGAQHLTRGGERPSAQRLPPRPRQLLETADTPARSAIAATVVPPNPRSVNSSRAAAAIRRRVSEGAALPPCPGRTAPESRRRRSPQSRSRLWG